MAGERKYRCCLEQNTHTHSTRSDHRIINQTKGNELKKSVQTRKDSVSEAAGGCSPRQGRLGLGQDD